MELPRHSRHNTDRLGVMRKIAAIAAVLALSACSDDPSDPGNDPALTLSADSVSVSIGGTTQVTATIVNSTAAAQFVSRDNTIADVSATGTINGIRAGRT